MLVVGRVKGKPRVALLVATLPPGNGMSTVCITFPGEEVCGEAVLVPVEVETYLLPAADSMTGALPTSVTVAGRVQAQSPVYTDFDSMAKRVYVKNLYSADSFIALVTYTSLDKTLTAIADRFGQDAEFYLPVLANFSTVFQVLAQKGGQFYLLSIAVNPWDHDWYVTFPDDFVPTSNPHAIYVDHLEFPQLLKDSYLYSVDYNPYDENPTGLAKVAPESYPYLYGAYSGGYYVPEASAGVNIAAGWPEGSAMVDVSALPAPAALGDAATKIASFLSKLVQKGKVVASAVKPAASKFVYTAAKSLLTGVKRGLLYASTAAKATVRTARGIGKVGAVLIGLGAISTIYGIGYTASSLADLQRQQNTSTIVSICQKIADSYLACVQQGGADCDRIRQFFIDSGCSQAPRVVQPSPSPQGLDLESLLGMMLLMIGMAILANVIRR